MKKLYEFIPYYVLEKYRTNFISKHSSFEYLEKCNGIIYGKEGLSAEQYNKEIVRKLEEGVPFMSGRMGATELSVAKTFDFEIHQNYAKVLNQFKQWSGFFPEEKEAAIQYVELMKKAVSCSDYLGIWYMPFEDYYIKKYAQKSVSLTHLDYLEPWLCPEQPWSVALEGKKVLVIHPFSETIKYQYARREKLFPGTDILPKFHLETLRAVQTVGKEVDRRFENWFQALAWMYEETLKIEFDIAIIGCGAYGLPLAAMLKNAGKMVIHLAGATQILFGIKGTRWEQETYSYVRSFYNEYWIKPLPIDTPDSAASVEDNSYW